jgi:flagellar hook protein FlgE
MTMFQAPADGNNSDLSAWTPASFAEDGFPAFNAVFTGTQGNALGVQSISMNMGLNLTGAWTTNYASAAAVGADPTGLYTGAAREHEARASTSFPGSSANIQRKDNGYGEGQLSSLSVKPDGTMVGSYSNGQTMELFRIPLYRFISEEGLQLEGGNHYSANTASGPAEAGFPDTENFGTLSELHLEQSTVDMAREFSSMILTQRGFQMNSKVVTTSDQMLQKALELKR